MKKIIYTLLSAMVVISCSGFLDEELKTSLEANATFDTETGLEAAITGCYNGFQGSGMYQGNMNEYLHTCSTLIHWKGNRISSEDTSGALYLTQFSMNSYNISTYSGHYAAIQRCNWVISNLKKSPVPESYKNEIEGEARLMRGILYFTLARLYGDVPLITEAIGDFTEGTNYPRTPYYKVYTQILEDLTYAEQNMRDKDRQHEVTGDQGRPHKWAATAFKAAVYVQIGSLLESVDNQFFDIRKEGRFPDFSTCDIFSAKDAWEKALKCAEDVISSGRYALATRYTDLFRWTSPEDYQLDERVFVLQSTNNGTSSNLTAVRSLPKYPEGTANVSLSNSNWGRYRPSRWIFQKWAGTYGGVKGTDANNSNIYVSCPDPRFDATFFHTNYQNQTLTSKTSIYPSSNRILTNSDEGYAPYFKKYLDPKYDVTTGYADFYLMRYAEVLLLAAEASASLSNVYGDAYWNKALMYVEKIHARARHSVDEGMADASQPRWEEGRFKTTQELVNAIVWERMFEMLGEGHEFFDTHRRGAEWMIDQITIPMNEFLQLPEQNPASGASGAWSYYYGKHVYPTDVEEVRRSLLCAFPESEIRYNTAIDYSDQNDFFWK